MTAIFLAECSCPNGHAVCATDEEATVLAWDHWRRRLTQEPGHRYWVVHGPSGHVIALKETPVGSLPPPPLPMDECLDASTS